MNGCTKQRSVTVTQNPQLASQTTISNERCPGEKNGKVTLQTTGGNIAISIQLGRVKSDSLTAGTYTVTITDANLCTVTKTALIKTNGGNKRPHLSVANNQTIVCKGDSIKITADAGFLSYQWTIPSTANVAYVHQGGTYSADATDSAGCVVHSDTIVIQSDSIPHLQITATANNLDAQLQASQSGLISYLWDFGNGDNATTTVSATNYAYADTGTYKIKLVTSHYCGNDTATYILHITNPTTGIAVMRTESFELQLAPNPFSEHSTLLISPASTTKSSIKIYGTDGRLVRDLGSVTGNSTIIHRDHLPVGITSYRFKTETH